MGDSHENLGVAAHRVEAQVIALRREFHEHPEVRFEENWTLAHIEEFVTSYIVPKRPPGTVNISRMRGGLVVDFVVNPGARFRLLRADVDALPIKEETGLPFASKIDGKSHACGHDAHMAMLLGAMLAIAETDIWVRRNIRFVFQRAEENPITQSGGDMLVNDEGVCVDVDDVHGVHIWQPGKPGVFQVRSGAALANSDRFRIQISCTGGHVAFPNKGSNAIDIGLAIANDMAGFGVRFLGPIEPLSLVPAVFQAGTGSNIRANKADMWFACRNTLDEKRRAEFANAIEMRIRGIVALYPDARMEWTYVNGHPALFNTPEDVERVTKLLQTWEQEVTGLELVMGGEDFAHYLRNCPGSFFMLGANKPGSGDHHTPNFDIDESVLWRGVLYWLLLMTEE